MRWGSLRWVMSAICLTAVFNAGLGRQVLPRYRIAYATYLGGSGAEQAREIIVLADGSVLVGAQTSSPDMPVTARALQPQYAGDDPTLGHPGIYGGDCYLARLNPEGSRLLAATYFGGSKQERNVYGMAMDEFGNVVITSATRSPDLPTGRGAYQPQYGGGASDWMVAKLSFGLDRLLWCTYVGGSGDDSPRGGLALDEQGYVYVVGGTESPDFPTTPAVVQVVLKGEGDAALVKLSPGGSRLEFGSLLGGSGRENFMGMQLDPRGNLHLAGHTWSNDFPVTEDAAQPRSGGKADAFIARFSPDGRRLLVSTYLGGGEDEFAEHRPWLAEDGSLWLTGVTASADFPTATNAVQRRLKGATDGFLTRLAADGKTLITSTLLGGTEGEFFLMPTPDDKGAVFLVGQTSSPDFPVTRGALQATYGGGDSDGVLAALSEDGSQLLYATYLGGSGDDIIRSLALGPDGEIYLAGGTSSPDFPVTAGAAQTRPAGGSDAFVVKLASWFISAGS